MLPLGIYLFFGSAVECVGMLRNSPSGKISTPALLGTAGIIAASCVPVLWPLAAGEPYPSDCLLGKLGWPMAAMLISLFANVAWFMPSYEQNSNFFLRAMTSGWVSCYFGGGFAFAIALRLVGESAWGLYLLVGIIVITKFADTGAYFVGRAFGKSKLCPNVSPGKTIEGLLGGMLFATLGGWIYFCIAGKFAFGDTISASVIGVVLLGILLTLAGVIGDLLESIVKRETGCKDSGKLLPGLGGLWDVTDSLLPAFVVAYLVVVAELIKGPGQ